MASHSPSCLTIHPTLLISTSCQSEAWTTSPGSTPAEYVKVDQHTTISKIRSDQSLPDLVRFPSLEKMREEINRLRTDRAEQRAQRRKNRAQRQERETDQ